MMHRRHFITLTSLALATGTSAPLAAQMTSAKPISPHADPAERAFIVQASRFLHAHYATPQKAREAGFVQFTPEDRTGAISWANLHWTSTDAEHPSQVWYDVKGRLIGADYSVPRTDTSQPPQLWGIDSRRWITINAHIHYGIETPQGVKFGAVGAKKFADAGGSIETPSKDTLVSMGLAKSLDQVAFIFLFPSIWDLQFWVIPNPEGEFAEYNPKIKPKAAHSHPMTM